MLKLRKTGTVDAYAVSGLPAGENWRIAPSSATAFRCIQRLVGRKSGFWRTFILKRNEVRLTKGIRSMKDFGSRKRRGKAWAFANAGHLAAGRQGWNRGVADVERTDRSLGSVIGQQRQGRGYHTTERDSRQNNDSLPFHAPYYRVNEHFLSM